MNNIQISKENLICVKLNSQRPRMPLAKSRLNYQSYGKWCINQLRLITGSEYIYIVSWN